MQQNLLLDRTRLAERLGVSTTTIKKLVKTGALPGPWRGRFFYWPHIVAAIEGTGEHDAEPLPRFLSKGRA